MDGMELEGAQEMNIKALWVESRTFVVGRISAGATYVFGSLTTAGGAAKAANDANVVPTWFPTITVDTVLLIIGAAMTVATGLVSIWAQRQGVKAKQAEKRRSDRAEERNRMAWVMEMLEKHGEEKMVSTFGHNWRERAIQIQRHPGNASTDFGALSDD